MTLDLEMKTRPIYFDRISLHVIYLQYEQMQTNAISIRCLWKKKGTTAITKRQCKQQRDDTGNVKKI